MEFNNISLTAEQERKLVSLAKTLRAEDGIKSVSTRNLLALPYFQTGDTFVLSIQFCPLYVKDSRGFNKHADLIKKDTFCEQDILDSCIGAKWTATKSVLTVLQKFLSEQKVTLSVKATFCDVGVIVTAEDFISPGMLDKHATIYKSSLEKFCEERSIECNFNCLSNYDQKDLQANWRVQQYVIASTGTILSQALSPLDLLAALDLSSRIDLQSRPGKRAVATFQKLLASCDYNFTVTKTFIYTYLFLAPFCTKDAHAQLGMEVVDIFLALATAEPRLRQHKMPCINVLAE